MKRRYKIITVLMMSVMVLGGCGTKGSSQETTEVEVTAEMAEEYVTLGDYEGITLTKYIYEITDEDFEAKKEEFMEDYRVQTEVTDRAVADGDFVSIEVTENEGDEAMEYGTVEITIGEEEFDAQIDAGLVGHGAGETVTIESSYLSDEGEETDITYTVTINNIYEVTYPEYNDDFVKENTEYNTVAELEEALKAQVEADNEEMSMDDLRESAITAVVECSQFKELPENLIESAYEQVKEMYENYAAMFGMELSDMASEEDLQEAAQYSVQEQMVLVSIVDKENIEIDKEGFEAYKKRCMEYMEVETEEELLEYYEDGELDQEYLRQKVGDAILAKAVITEEAYDEEDEYYEEEPEIDTDVILEDASETETEEN